MREEIDRLES